MQTKYLIQNNDDAIIPEETDEVFKGETRKGNDKNCPFLLYFNDFLSLPIFLSYILFYFSNNDWIGGWFGGCVDLGNFPYHLYLHEE